MKQKSIIIACILVSIFLRILALFVLDITSIKYWEYGDIAQNIFVGKGYSFLYEIKQTLCYHFKPEADVQPSAFMPPGYVLFLIPFFYIKNILYRNIIIIVFQHLISFVSIYILSQLVAKKFSENTATILIFIGLLLPEFIVATHFIGPTIFYHLILSLIFFFIYNLGKDKYSIWGLSMTIAIGIYFRSELILLFIGFVLLWIKEKRWNWIAKSTLIVILVLSPWVVRNYLIFNHFIPLTTNGGMNLYRGHNLEQSGGWPTPLDTGLLKKIIQEPNFEYELHQMFLNDALLVIKQNPQKEIWLTFKKCVQFWFFDWEDERTKSPFYLVPWLIVLLMSIVGIYLNYNWEKFKYEYLYLISITVTIIIFFPLLRYQTMMKFMLLPFAADVVRLINYFIKRKLTAGTQF